MINKQYPASPDITIRGSEEREKALPRFAHLNAVVDEMNVILTGPGNGTAGTGVLAEETGIGESRTTKLTLTNFVVGALPGAAVAEALGDIVYTLPAGAQLVEVAYMNVGFTAAGTANTPDVGIGSVVGSGANADLGSVGAAAEDYITGQTAADITGTAVEASANPNFVSSTGGSKLVHLNAASTWAGDNTGDLTATGTIVLKWTILA